MSPTPRRDDRLLAWADSFVPAGSHDVELIRRVRVAVAQAALGVPCTLIMAAFHAAMGSPIAAVAIASVSAGLFAVPLLLRGGVAVTVVGNATVAVASLATLVVATRTGGFAAPAVVWSFLLPLCVYAVCGRRSAVAWSVFVGVQVVGLYLAPSVGVTAVTDLGPSELAALRLVAYLGVLGATLALLLVIDGARRASLRAQRQAEQALERQRILDDMHDGVGSHLLGLLVQSRAGTLGQTELVASLETCIDDLRLIVDSLDPIHGSLDASFAALRARLASRCEGLGMSMAWDVDPDLVSSLNAVEGTHLLRAAQEMVTNALRHAAMARIDLHLGALREGSSRSPGVELSVRDYGVGLHPDAKRGRGMRSLEMRARKLGGSLVVQPVDPGLRVAIELPAPKPPKFTGYRPEPARGSMPGTRCGRAEGAPSKEHRTS